MKEWLTDLKWVVLVFGSLLAVILGPMFLSNKTTHVVEVRNEHLVWDSPGCKVYQLVIENEWGTHVLFVTTPAPEKMSPLKQASYPTCRVTK